MGSRAIGSRKKGSGDVSRVRSASTGIPRHRQGSRSSLIAGSHQTPLRRSPRFLTYQKLNSEISSQMSTFCKNYGEMHSGSPSISSKSKQKTSYRTIRQKVPVKSQLKLSRSNFSGGLEEAQNDCRRSLRLASVTKTIAFESPQRCLHVYGRRQSATLLGIASVSPEDVKQGAKNSKVSNEIDYKEFVHCKIMNPQILRRSMRLISAAASAGKELNEPKIFSKSNIEKSPKKDGGSMRSQIQLPSHGLETKALDGVMKRVSLNITDKEDVADMINADRRDLVLERRIGDEFLTDEIHKEKRKLDKHNGMENMIEKIENADCHVSLAWTSDQEEALQKAYIMAKPSPHFWKKVARMVPGKSAQDCFDKIHSSIATPHSAQLGSKIRRKSLSPICTFSLSGTISPQVSKLDLGRLGRNRTRKLAAQKTVRHLLRKHRLTDQENAIDHFSLLESSPINITSNTPNVRPPETSSSTSNSPSTLLHQTDERLPSNRKTLSRFKPLTSPSDPSPAVLKKIKNRALHDRYIDQLHHREARRVMLAKKINSGVVCMSEHGDLRAARTALISDAVSFIKHFRESQANPVHEMEEDELNDYYGSDGDIDVDDVDE